MKCSYGGYSVGWKDEMRQMKVFKSVVESSYIPTSPEVQEHSKPQARAIRPSLEIWFIKSKILCNSNGIKIMESTGNWKRISRNSNVFMKKSRGFNILRTSLFLDPETGALSK